MCVLHSCDNKRCVNPYHLRLGTQADNVADAMERFSYITGRTSKFSEDEVQLMRKLYGSGIPQWRIAEMYKVSGGYVSRLINDKRGVNTIK